MMTLKSLIKRYPAASYYLLTFVISWGGILAVIGGPGFLPGTPEQIETRMLLALLALFAGPSVASILVIGLVHGKPGYRNLFSRMAKWRVSPRWYVLALLIAPIFFGGASLLLSLQSSEFLPAILTADNKGALLLFGLAWGSIGGGLLEELGWTGFATPTLKPRYSVLTTGLIIGLLWGAWHFLIIFWMSSPSGEIPLALLLPVQLFSWLPAYRVLMVWVYYHTESMLVVMLMHASLSASMLILQPAAMAGMSLLVYILTFGAMLWVIVAAVALANRREISRPPVRRQMV